MAVTSIDPSSITHTHTHTPQVGDLLRSLPEAPETVSRVLGGVFELGASRVTDHAQSAGTAAFICLCVDVYLCVCANPHLNPPSCYAQVLEFQDLILQLRVMLCMR